MSIEAEEAARIAAQTARLSPLALDIVRRLGYEVRSYGQVAVPGMDGQIRDEMVYLSIGVFNRIVYQIASAMTDVRLAQVAPPPNGS